MNATSALAVTGACLALAATADGQAQAPAPSTWLLRARVVSEAVAARDNTGSPLLAATAADWQRGLVVLATADSSWTPVSRIKLAGAAALSGETGSGGASVRVREAYGRLSAADWLDVEVGKRVLKWGTGYAFTPTGVLDPPRDATDPQDRLGMNEGVLFAGVNAYRGVTALSLVAAAPATWRASTASSPQWTAAARLRTVVRGFEFALVASASSERDDAVGANFTHVIGRRLEWHGEWLARYRRANGTSGPEPGTPDGRALSALVGCQYTFDAGVSVVVEYYRDGAGLDPDAWDRAVALLHAPHPAGAGVPIASAARPTGAAGLRQFAFVRAAPASGELRVTPEAVAIVGLDDGSVTLVPAVTWTVRDHVQIYGRATALTGRRDSVARLAPSKGELRIGVAVRF
jgi:hypothetical protein